jgi:RNA polymerase sigma-70 factor (ECF subfamily)
MTTYTYDAAPLPLEQLLADAHAGNRQALGALLEGFRGYLLVESRRDMRKDLQVKVPPSDVVQDTLLDAQVDFDQFHGTTREQLRNWLRRLLEHHLGHAFRKYLATAKRQLSREVPLDDSHVAKALEDQLVARTPAPADEVAETEQVQRVREALPQLGASDREVLRWHFWEKLTFAEIGCRLGISADAARSKFRRAVKRVAELMGSDE